ncbi:MAG: threonine-phosphate decarboxylase CobD [Candidatus Scalindua sp.]|nr:threonine-phosphate decarboxylase CobD [Candidatus Scalindua sp.]
MLDGHGGNSKKMGNLYGIDPGEILDFSANINPLGYPDCVRTAILDRFDDILSYPDSECTDLRNAIAVKYSCNEANIMAGNGSNELFYLIPRALKPGSGIILQPTFGEFQDALISANVEITDVMNEDDNFPLFNLQDSQLKACREELIIFCNPNNPTGQLVPREEIVKFAEDNAERFVVIDEAFMDFVEEEERFSVLQDVHTLKNLIVVRSLTKFYGFPGLRLGFLVASTPIMNKLWKLKEPWTVNSFAQVAGKIALNDDAFAVKTREFVSSEKIFLYEGLSQIEGLRPFYPSVNFILIRIDNENLISSILQNLLIRDKIIIRDCSNFVGLNENYVRVAVRSRKENQRLLDAMKEAVRIAESSEMM